MSQPQFQFGLRHLLLFNFMVCGYFAIHRAAGAFFAGLVLGLLVICSVVILLRFESIVVGAIAGLCLAIAIVLVLRVMYLQETPPLVAFFGYIFYPPIGYLIGLTCTTDQIIRAG